jgi:sugar lactone lactonase YvrE
MYVIGFSASAYQYTLSTAFDVSTASYASKSFSVNSQEQYPFEINFNPNGTKMYIVGSNTSSAYQYTLSTAFDLSTASYDYVSLSTAGQDGTPDGITFNTDGTKMYIVGNDNDKVFQYDIGSTLVQIPVVYSSDYAVAVTNSGGQINTTYWADVNSTTATEAVGTGEVYYAYSTDNHVTWKVIHNTDGQRSIVRNNSGTWQYNSNVTYGSETWANATTNTEFAALRQALAPVVQGFQLSASTQIHGLDISSYETEPQGMFVKDDGTEIYISAGAGQGVDQFTLSTAFDLTTASHTAFQSTSSQGLNPRGVFFKPDGTKMYEVQGSTQDVKQYSLSTAWDITTLSYDSVAFVTSGQVTNLRGVTFKSDGTKMYVVGASSSVVAEYNLSTPWDISTASYNSVSYNFSSQVAGAQTLAIQNDGKTMLIGGQNQTELYKYTLSTAWDITTASFVETFAGSADFVGAMFGDGGEKLYYTHYYGTQADTIQEYTATALVPHPANLMDGAQMDAVADANHLTLANSLDFMIALKNADSTSASPTSDGVALNYDANVLNQGAVLGTDYNWDFPSSTSVRLTSLGAYNLKVRII